MSKKLQGYKMSAFELAVIYLVRLQYFIGKSFYVILNKRIAITFALSMFKEYLSQHLSVGRVFLVSSMFSVGCQSLESMLNMKS